MICPKCASIADHPSNVNETVLHNNCTNPSTCPCKHGDTGGPVEKLYDSILVDTEWVRTRRTINYSKPETVQ